MPARRLQLLAILAALVAAPCSAAMPTLPDDTVLSATPRQMLSLADDLLTLGRQAQAVQILELLCRDPNADVRNEARYRRSKLLQSQGATSDAAVLLRRILDEKPNAVPVRIALAQLLDKMGDKDAAWLQIRAAQATSLPPSVAHLVDRYSEALRAQRKMGASFEIALAPDSNISRATRSDTLGTVLGDFRIDPDSKAKSGTGLALQGQLFRRLSLGGDSTLLLRATETGNLYRKSRYNDVAVDFAAGPELQWGANRITLEAGATQRWYGQRPFQRSARLGFSLTRSLRTASQLRLVGVAGLVDNRLNDLEDGKVYLGEVAFEQMLSATAGVALNLTADRRSLRDPGYSTTGWSAGVIGWHDVGRATITAEVQYGRLEADERLILFPNKRSDQSTRFTIGMTFRQLTFRGFAPITRLVVERNRSTIEFYDYRRARTEVGITRAF